FSTRPDLNLDRPRFIFQPDARGGHGVLVGCIAIVQCTLNLRNAAFWPFSAKALSYLFGEIHGERQ
ncbi:hypothetical protein, partial [Mesorhizobium sp. M1E.F.Ca.ET.063.01.1.1]|uniref:hypothetical protein n=1 Tax=Mesorhizobium sp. M1E.F.Ca.ET.063.01.1.1 TaxID=2496750 RepID=UPI001AECBDAE